MRLALAPVLAATLAFGAGCAVQAETRDEEAVVQTAALVHLERNEGSSHVVARYVRAAKVSADAVRATGGTFDLPALGQCSPIDTHASGAPAPVELLAAGSTAVLQGDAVVELVARSVPDMSDLVSGFVYSKTAPLEPGPATLVLAGIDPIGIDVPTPLADLEVDGVRAATLDLDASAAAVRLTWAAAPGDSVVVADVHGGSAAMRCTLEDTGAGEIDRAWFGAQGTLVLRRMVHLELEREPFQRVVVDTETSRALPYSKSAR